MFDISVIVPGIRTYNWIKLYNSIIESTKRSIETIFIGPTEPPQQLKDTIYIKDFGTPIRCQQIGLIHASGKYFIWAADDGVFLKDSLDIAYNLAEENQDKVIVGKYREGDNYSPDMNNNCYYEMNYHKCFRTPYLPNNCYILNVGLVSTKLLKEFGGWDAENFEVCPMAYADLSIRLRRSGIEYLMQDEVMFECGHMPGTTGDHGPIHCAQTEHDEPLFTQIYSNESCLNRIKIDINNWQKSPEKWKRRFND